MPADPLLITIVTYFGRLVLQLMDDLTSVRAGLGPPSFMLHWLSVVLEERGGIGKSDTLLAAYREPGRFGPVPDHNPFSPDYLRLQRDLLHVPRRCQELDRDGVTAGIWRDLKAFARETFPDEAEAWIRDLTPVNDGTETAARGPDESAWKQMLAALGEESALGIMSIAQNEKLSADERMRQIYTLDSRALGWKSPMWARVLRNVTAQAVRQTKWWKVERRKLMRPD
jgi:hypothetical protein